MNCISDDELMRYLDEELPTPERRTIEKHLSECTLCRNKLEKYNNQFKIFDDMLRTPELSDSFTGEIMSKIMNESDAAEGKKVCKPQKRQKTSIFKKLALSAAAFVLIIFLSAAFSPTFASYLKKLLFLTSPVIVEFEEFYGGFKSAAEKGLVSSPEIQVTDQNLTVTVKEVVADSFQIAVILRVQDRKGNELPGELLREGFLDRNNNVNSYAVTDVTGQNLHLLKGARLGTEGADKDFILTLSLDETFSKQGLPERFIFKLYIKQIGNQTGDWDLPIVLDLKESLSRVKTMNFDDRHTTRAGIVVGLTKVKLMPTSAHVTVESSLTDARKRQLDQLLANYHGTDKFEYKFSTEYYHYSYRIVDEQGKTIAASDGMLAADLRKSEQKGIKHASQIANKDGVSTYKYEFLPFPDNRPLWFEFTGVINGEYPSFSIRFKPEELAKQQPVFRDDYGNELTVTSFKVKPQTNEGPKSLQKAGWLIELDGDFNENVTGMSHWNVTDDQGKKFHGPVIEYDNIVHKNGKTSFHLSLLFLGLKHQPKELSLSPGFMEKWYDENWKIPIVPATEQKSR